MGRGTVGAWLVALVLAGAAHAEPQTLRIVGSGTLKPALEGLARIFHASHADVIVDIESRGSSTGPSALLAERAHLASMSRPLNSAERQAFARRHGGVPEAVPIALDAVVVFVNEDNPLAGLTLPQVDAIFSNTRRCGAEAPLVYWRELGLIGKFADRHIQTFGRNRSSGTRAFFRELALCGGLFRDDLRERPGPESLALSVAETEYGIAYGSRAAGLTDGVRIVPLARAKGEARVLPDAESVDSGAYPLSRKLLLYAMPGEPAEMVADFLALATSGEGQAIVEAAGFLPVR